jgi:hypothetical protein
MAKKIIAQKTTAKKASKKKVSKKKAVKKTVAVKKALKKKIMPEMMGMMGGGKDKSGMMQMMPQIMMQMMPQMMMQMMPQMMLQMMPQCLRMMLPNIPKEKRIDFVMKMIDTLVAEGCVGLSKKDRNIFVAEVIKKVKT